MKKSEKEEMKPVKSLGHLQLDIMRILWKRGEATVAQVHQTISASRSLATTTVATMLSRLEKAGVVSHRAEGRLFIYRPLVSEKDVRRSMVRELVDRLFLGDSQALVGHLIQESEIRPGDLEQVAELLKDDQGDD